MSEIWVPCPKCGKMHAFPLGVLGFVKKLEITCVCGEKILREKPVDRRFGDEAILR
jgi:hypothetical protein